MTGTATRAAKPASRYSRIWKGASEAGLSKDAVHDIAYREFHKKSLTELTDRQVALLGKIIWDEANGRSCYPKQSKPSNKGGRPETQRLRARLYMEAIKIGWTPERVDGFVFKRFHISKQQWISSGQCCVMIETFKDMVRRAKEPYVSALIAVLNQRGDIIRGD